MLKTIKVDITILAIFNALGTQQFQHLPRKIAQIEEMSDLKSNFEDSLLQFFKSTTISQNLIAQFLC